MCDLDRAVLLEPLDIFVLRRALWPWILAGHRAVIPPGSDFGMTIGEGERTLIAVVKCRITLQPVDSRLKGIKTGHADQETTIIDPI